MMTSSSNAEAEFHDSSIIYHNCFKCGDTAHKIGLSGLQLKVDRGAFRSIKSESWVRKRHAKATRLFRQCLEERYHKSSYGSTVVV